jgi:molybdopterin-guanine dinucleotide biosynthesis protein A
MVIAMSMPLVQFNGLILAGGKSSRMGKDKSVIDYHGKPQIEVAFDLLTPFCTQTFVSTRRDQADHEHFKKFPQVHDDPCFEDKGPLAGILSAMKKFPTSSWLVLACDLPFVTPQTIDHLIKNRDSARIATAYKSSHDGLPEPLCALWESGYYSSILQLFKQGVHCPRKVLIRLHAQILEPLDPKALDNVNNPEEYQEALKTLGRQ